MIFNGIKFYHVFTAGDYPQGNFSAAQVADIAFYYSTAFREAPVWRGHNRNKEQTLGVNEPEALGWINTVVSYQGKLYVSFSHVSDELSYLVETKRFKYVSVELDAYRLQNQKLIWYLSALGLTNRPGVDGLEPLAFDKQDAAGENKFTHIPSEYSQAKFTYQESFDSKQIEEKIIFTIELPNSNNQNQNQMTLTQSTKNILTAVGLDVTKFVTEEAALEAIQKTVTDSATESATLKSKVTELETKLNASPAQNQNSAEFTSLKSELDALKDRAANALVNQGIADLKIIPADKQVYVDLAKKDYAIAERTISSMGVHATLTKQQIQNSGAAPVVSADDPKFIKPDGSAYTYEEVLKDKILESKFSAAELALLKKKSITFGHLS